MAYIDIIKDKARMDKKTIVLSKSFTHQGLFLPDNKSPCTQ